MSPSLSPGTRLGTYQIVGVLGAGGMGEVYRARDSRLGREVALKLLPSSLTASSDRLARFEREARTVAGLSHPNIVTLFSVEEEDGARFLTMELIEGQPLDRMVTSQGLPLARVLEVAIPLAHALIAAHERGVVHRDLKPGNVMVTADGWVKVLDFGLAKTALGAGVGGDDGETLAATAHGELSTAGQVLGTIPYMSPEQLRGETVDARSDLFSFGVLLYELASGRRPFGGATSADVSSAILRDAPVPLSSLRAELPRDLHRIVNRCLEKQPRDRFQTARDVYNELRYLQRETDSGAGTVATTSTSSVSNAGPPSTAPATGPVSSAASHAKEQASIAVLPFVNRSRDEDDEYFADGLADELLNVLTKVRGLRVAARASSFQFKGKNEDVAAIGEKLNVATLLDGTVRKAGSRVRISVQLVKASDRVQLWSETYDRSLDDIFAVQDDIAQSVVKELRTTLLGEGDSAASDEARAAVAAAPRVHGSSPEAHRLFLLGKHLVDRMSEKDVELGIRHLKDALELDPSHAAAWAALGHALGLAAGYGWRPIQEGWTQSRAALERALALAPDFAEVHARMSEINRLFDWDWRTAEARARRAFELEPGNPLSLRSLAAIAEVMGRHQEALQLIRRAVELDPLSPSAYHRLAMCSRSAGDLVAAEHAIRKALELSPSRVASKLVLAVVLTDQGQFDEALAAAREEATEWARLTALAYVHARRGESAESERYLAELIAGYADTSAYQIGAVHAARGDADQVFHWLNECIRIRDAGTPQVAFDPIFKRFHSDPRWHELMMKLGLPG